MSGIFKAVGNIFSSLFGGGESTPPPIPAPVVTPVTPIPLPDDQAVADAKRRSIAAQMQRSGRQSTLLTSDAPTGGTLG